MKHIRSMCWGLIILLGCLMSSQNVTAESEFAASRLEVHGFVSQGFLKSWENNVFAGTEDGTFQFNEFGVNVMTELIEQLHVGVQIFSRDLGDIGNNEVILDWAYGDYRWRDWLGVRAGQIKIPYGLYNETRDIDMLRTSIFLPSSIYYEGNRERQNTLIGAGVYGDISAAALGTFTYQVQIGDANMSSESGDMKYAQDQNSALATMEIDRQYTADLEWETPLEGLRLGGFIMQTDLSIELSDTTSSDETTSDAASSDASATASDTSAESENPPSSDSSSRFVPDETQRFYIVSAEYGWNNLTLSGEYQIAPDSHAPEGYYLGASYRLNDHFEFGGYYSAYYGRASDKDGKQREEQGMADYSAWQKEWVASVRVDLNTSWTIKAEGHLINGTAQMLTQDNPDDMKEDSYLFALKTSYLF